jgi:hypothetical protein
MPSVGWEAQRLERQAEAEKGGHDLAKPIPGIIEARRYEAQGMHVTKVHSCTGAVHQSKAACISQQEQTYNLQKYVHKLQLPAGSQAIQARHALVLGLPFDMSPS